MKDTISSLLHNMIYQIKIVYFGDYVALEVHDSLTDRQIKQINQC